MRLLLVFLGSLGNYFLNVDPHPKINAPCTIGPGGGDASRKWFHGRSASPCGCEAGSFTRHAVPSRMLTNVAVVLDAEHDAARAVGAVEQARAADRRYRGCNTGLGLGMGREETSRAEEYYAVLNAEDVAATGTRSTKYARSGSAMHAPFEAAPCSRQCHV